MMHQFASMVAGIMAPKLVHAPILGTCDYIALYCKSNFADIINVKDLKMGDHSRFWVGPT